MAAPQTSSRLQLLQARFQQRQLQEKEQKLLQLYDQQQQRAHQVALRGSAGSNDSNGSSQGSVISNPGGKVRQMFDERRQSNTRGIDKSYPLDPLNGKTRKQPGSNRRSLGTKRATRTDAGVASQQRDNASRESYASSRDTYKESTVQRENVSRESYASSRSNEASEQSNGHEINIEEVIDNEAVQRNRTLAKFLPTDLEGRPQLDSRFSGDVADAPLDKTAARRTSQVERFKNPRKMNAAAATRKPSIPTGTNASSTKNSTADSSTQKADSRSVDVKGKKSTSPRPSSESPEDTLEQKNRPPVKSTSLKFLNHIVGETPGENGLRRKSSVSGIDGLDSTSTPLKDEKPATSMPQATRASPSLSSNTSMGTSRDQPTSSIRSFNKAKSVVVMSTPMQRLSAPHRNASNSDDSLARCKVCSRRFSVERIGFHEEICAKTAQKKRKQFDAVTHRVKGTEFESFVKKPFGRKSKAAKPDPEPELPKSNWRRKHEDFINAIRSAKQMQTHLAGGGKLSDLPPPPKSDTSDYVQCPHCSRRFNQGAASRHIPKCDTMQHNKPAQRAPVKSRR